jgi:hypothetical protein
MSDATEPKRSRKFLLRGGSTSLASFVAAHDHIYVVDPFGYQMMLFPRDADAHQMKKESAKLAKVSGG